MKEVGVSTLSGTSQISQWHTSALKVCHFVPVPSWHALFEIPAYNYHLVLCSLTVVFIIITYSA